MVFHSKEIFGLANAYIGLKNGPKLAQTAERLVAIEPMNEEIVRMLANGQRMAKKETQANKTAGRVLSMPVTVSVDQFAPSAAGATMRPPTSHYYPSAPSASSSDPYREQLMHEAMMAQGTPIKRESMPPSPPPAENGHGGYGNVMLPGYHGLLQTLEPEFPFGTQHVHVGYPPNIMPGANHDNENGCHGGDAGNNGHNVYGQQHPY
jgi:hypothetical protein